MKKLIVLIFIFSLSGCAGMFAPPDRWVNDNTFHSTKSPRISIEVDESMIYYPSTIEKGLTTDVNDQFIAGENTEWFKFRDENRQKALNIKIETLDYTNRIHMGRPDYSKWKGVLFSHSEKINNEMYAIGILGVYDQKRTLLKAYGRVVGDAIRYQIFYLEAVDSDWSKKNPNYLSGEEQSFLAEFNERADASFSIKPYNENETSVSENHPTVDGELKKESVLSIKERLQKIQELYKDGIITENEYQEKRKKILSDL